MPPTPTQWNPISINEIQSLCGDFEDWVLCGGHSVALFTGDDRRPHGDIDISIFRSQAVACLQAIGKQKVFLAANKTLVPWDGSPIPDEVHDIWIANPESNEWILQIMIYDDDEDRVYYRRNRAISWSKESHSFMKDGIRILNPFVTFLFKSNQPNLEPKEIDDLIQLIEKGVGVQWKKESD
ncbi:MAG: hypothetical protein CMO55_12470 [Verrucomicrobiales bacterium]|nr:hypothetical protein [Verrucomicrobiales bacterium]